MRTILYNDQTKQLSKFYENGYNLPIREPYMHELTVVDIAPEIGVNQWLTSEWTVDLENKQYKRVYTVHTKTAYQLDCEDWMHMDYAIRIVAPKELALEYPNIYVWFQVNDFPIEKRGGEVLLYCNEILPQHQPLIDMIESIYIEYRPNE